MKTSFVRLPKSRAALLPLLTAGALLAPAAQSTTVNCNNIWQRSGSGWYENNPTYTDPRNDTVDWIISTPEAEGMDGDLIDEGVDDIRTSTLRSVLILRNGKLVYERYLNGGARNKANNIHSASKTLLRLALGIATNQGYIPSLDTKVSTILPEHFTNASTTKKNITLRQLVTMRAGFRWTEDETEYQIEKTSNWVRSIIALPLQTTPGTAFKYNTGLTHVLSAVLQRATGTNTCNFTHTQLLNAMNVTAEHWGKDPNGIYSGGYNVYMTPREMAKLGLLLVNRGNWNGSQLVPASVIDEMQVEVSPKVDGFGYGQLVWTRNISGHDLYLAWGFAGQFIYVIPDFDLVMVTSQSPSNEDLEIESGYFIEEYLLPSIFD